ncbi:hypothetical protein [Saccharopolyspora pogona]|uniref:hypothetical protein n=1 Tax=Saccharopolyspora pogona TaxID=333966 RepID=UPI001CC2262D|nr:hypothetical protein [Saccharopolyspora pogona]
MLARLLGLTKELSPAAGLALPGMGWEMGKQVLDVKRGDCEQLFGDVPKFQPMLGKRQCAVVQSYMAMIPTRIYGLDFIVMMYETSGIIELERKRCGPGEKLKMAPLIEATFFTLVEDISCVYTALLLTRARPWSYYRRLRAFARRLDEVNKRLPNFSSLPENQAA